MSAEEFIHSYLSYLARKHGTTEPKIRFGTPAGIGMYSPSDDEIVLHEVIIDMWNVDQENTKKVLKWLIAHEYRHFLTLPYLPKIGEEGVARWFAWRETGMTYGTFWALTDELLVKLGLPPWFGFTVGIQHRLKSWRDLIKR